MAGWRIVAVRIVLFGQSKAESFIEQLSTAKAKVN